MLDISKLIDRVESQKRMILSKIVRLKKEDPFATEDRALIVEPGTDAASLFGHEKTVILENQLKRDLKEIEAALQKFKRGTYGLCEKCKNAIDIARLEVKPASIYCLRCENEFEKKGKK